MTNDEKYGIINKSKLRGEIFVVYFSSISNNTHRFVEKLNFEKARIPVEIDQELVVDKDYVLFCPTYSGGKGLRSGAVPKQVIKFLNNEQNRRFCKAVIASGNTNFGDTFALAGTIISQKLKVPFLYSFELLGTNDDIKKVRQILEDFWGK